MSVNAGREIGRGEGDESLVVHGEPRVLAEDEDAVHVEEDGPDGASKASRTPRHLHTGG